MSESPTLKILDGDDVESDLEFDRIYPMPLGRLSELHWTPVAVAKRAAELLDCSAGQSVLDIGAGVGKFCIVGALTTSATFVGVERREYLVRVGQGVIQRHRVERVELIEGDGFALDWSRFDGLYFYNPFHDSGPDQIAIRRAERKLWEARPGARVVTYHGFGGDMPECYRLVAREPVGTDQLAVWERAQPSEVA
jgi:hypothetical protein